MLGLFCYRKEIRMKLTPRLRAVAELVPCGSCIADIGTDHAYVPIFLIHNGRIKYAIAGDIHAGPAQRAREHIKREGLSTKIKVREGAGLSILEEDEVDGAVIAGMGGFMIRNMLLLKVLSGLSCSHKTIHPIYIFGCSKMDIKLNRKFLLKKERSFMRSFM